jgi:hypothetical protein
MMFHFQVYTGALQALSDDSWRCSNFTTSRAGISNSRRNLQETATEAEEEELQVCGSRQQPGGVAQCPGWLTEFIGQKKQFNKQCSSTVQQFNKQCSSTNSTVQQFNSSTNSAVQQTVQFNSSTVQQTVQFNKTKIKRLMMRLTVVISDQPI